MKKKFLVFTLLAAALVGTLSSCSDKNNDNENQNTMPVRTQYNLVQDNSTSRSIFNEFSNEFSNKYSDVTYDDFLIYCELYDSNVGSETYHFYHYLSGIIRLDSNDEFVSKIIYLDNKRTESLYLNNEFVKKIEEQEIKGTYKTTYLLNLNADNSFNSKIEYTYDESGNLLTEVEYVYQNGQWVLQN